MLPQWGIHTKIRPCLPQKSARKTKNTAFLEKSGKKIWWNRQNALPLHTQKQKGSLAQLNRASDYGSEGCGFESRGSHLKIKELQRCNSFLFYLYDTNLIQNLGFRGFLKGSEKNSPRILFGSFHIQSPTHWNIFRRIIRFFSRIFHKSIFSPRCWQALRFPNGNYLR